MTLRKINYFGMGVGAIILIIDLIFFLSKEQKNIFMFLLGVAIASVALPFVISISIDNKREQEIADMFLEFSRNLAESVATGTPVSKSIVNMKSKNYGVLSPYIQKLSNQISVGIPVSQALKIFAHDVDSPVITRAVTLISEAEKAGGERDYILESTAKSIAETEQLKKERKAAVYSIIVQGYIIFFIFIGIMLVIEFKILPLTAGIGSFGGINPSFSSFTDLQNQDKNSCQMQGAMSIEELSSPLFYLLIAQGLFAGLVIGKVTEGNLKSGVKHSFILAIAAFLVSTGANLVFGGIAS